MVRFTLSSADREPRRSTKAMLSWASLELAYLSTYVAHWPLQKRRSSKSTVHLAGSGLLAHSSCEEATVFGATRLSCTH